jgi:hypothetical protein
MREFPADEKVVSEIETVRTALPAWVISTVELIELRKTPNVLLSTSIRRLLIAKTYRRDRRMAAEVERVASA